MSYYEKHFQYEFNVQNEQKIFLDLIYVTINVILWLVFLSDLVFIKGLFMLTALEEMFLYYWPKLVAALYFAFMNTWIMAKFFKRKKLPLMFITMFFISSAFVSIPGEYFASFFYSKLVKIVEPSTGLYVIWNITSDFITICIFMLVYIKVIKLPATRSISIYIQYACLERLCMILANSAVSYLIILLLLHGHVLLLLKDDLNYMTKTDTMRWDKLLFHEFGLLFILDSLYGVYIISPNVGTNTINFQTIWIDMIAILTSGYIMALIKSATREGILSTHKMDYMRQFQEGQEHIIQTFAELSEAKSGETGQHVKRVAEYCKAIAVNMGIDEQEAEYFRVAAMMHDVGKLLIPKDIIEKPDKLTPEEFEIVKAHTVYGDELLSKSEGNIISIARVVAHQHHERWDGKGYPQGLAGDQINLYAQITSVADVYDALSSKRAYKDAWKPDEAFNEIVKNKGTQFSPAVVDAFVSVYKDIDNVREKYQD